MVWVASVPVLVLVGGLLLPARTVIPVQGATANDWNHETFWYHPWGRSVVHKGIDIFAEEGRPVLAAGSGIVTFSGPTPVGGNVVVVLGARWRLHYYAHLREIAVARGTVVRCGEVIGELGSTGNAKGKPPHLHYSIVTAVPYPWRMDRSPQGYLKAVFLDPGAVIGGG
jgi:murein DD-endopeptidase MepM/ murein hydrolase activator NlpD